MTQQLMTVELLKAVLPKNLHTNATQDFADTINTLALDPEACAEVRQNFITYSKVLADGKFKTEDYLNAVLYASHKLMGYSNKEAYTRAFPERYQALVSRGATDKDISAYVAAYARNKLVNAILEQALIPAHLLHQDAFNAAVATQVRLMTGASSEKVQSDAANSILTHLKAPEVKKVEMDVNVKQNGGIDDLRATMEELARTQLELIQKGKLSPKVAAESRLIVSEAEKASAIDVVPVPVPEPAVLEHAVLEQAVPAPVPDPRGPRWMNAPSLFED